MQVRAAGKGTGMNRGTARYLRPRGRLRLFIEALSVMGDGSAVYATWAELEGGTKAVGVAAVVVFGGDAGWAEVDDARTTRRWTSRASARLVTWRSTGRENWLKSNKILP